MKSPLRSPEIRRAKERATRLGFEVVFMDSPVAFVPGSPVMSPLGFAAAGICDLDAKQVRVAVRGRSRAEIAGIIDHELDHAEGAERGRTLPGLRCGGVVR